MKKLLTGMMICCLAVTGNTYAQNPLSVKATGVHPLLIGETVPSATVTGSGGENINIQQLAGKQKTVLVFYRGGWCLYCNKHLAELAMIEKDLAALGYQIVAISPDKPENLRGTATKIKPGYSLYSDSKGELIKAMGIAYQVPAHYATLVKEASGGVTQDFLPVPSVFLLDTKGTILFSYVNPDFKQRVNGKLLLAAAQALK